MSHFARSNAAAACAVGCVRGGAGDVLGTFEDWGLGPFGANCAASEKSARPRRENLATYSQHIAVDARVFGKGNALGTRWRQGFASAMVRT